MALGIRTLAACSIVTLCGCAGAGLTERSQAVVAHGPLEYELAVDKSLTTLDESICWESNGLQALRTSGANGMRVLRSTSSGSGEPVRRTGDLLDLSALDEADCVTLSIDLSAVAERRVIRPSRDELAPSLWLPTDSWMWFDNDDPRRSDGIVRWSLPPGIEAATPWEAGAAQTSIVRSDDFDWKTIVALGALERRVLHAAGATVRLTAVDPTHLPSHDVIDGWLSRALEAVASLYGGTFPREELQLLLIPTQRPASEPVVFGLVARGGHIPTVSLFLSSDATHDSLRGEWVTIHELLHLGMPYVAAMDAWISEGFVTYMTEVLRARFGYFDSDRDFPGSVGLDFSDVDATQAQALMALTTLRLGVERGKQESSRLNLSLRDASARLGELHAFMLVYWGGASVAMRLDQRLRAISRGLSLDLLFRRWSKLIGGPKKVWLAHQLLFDPVVVDRMSPEALRELEIAAAAADVTPVFFADETLRTMGLRYNHDLGLFSLHDRGDPQPGITEESSGLDAMRIFAPETTAADSRGHPYPLPP